MPKVSPRPSGKFPNCQDDKQQMGQETCYKVVQIHEKFVICKEPIGDIDMDSNKLFFASWNVLGDRFSGRDCGGDEKEKHEKICNIVFNFLDEKSTLGSCVSLQEVEPLLHDALQERIREIALPQDKGRHHIHFVPHGESVWSVDAFPWSMTVPREWSNTVRNIGNAIILRVSKTESPPKDDIYSLDERQSPEGAPEGNLVPVIHWRNRTYASVHVCTVLSPVRHYRQMQRLKALISSNESGIIAGADLNNPCLLDRNGRPGTYNICGLSFPIDSILSTLRDVSLVELWRETSKDSLSDHTGIKCQAIVAPTTSACYSTTRWKVLSDR